jgi:ribosome-associated GTPase EngA
VLVPVQNIIVLYPCVVPLKVFCKQTRQQNRKEQNRSTMRRSILCIAFVTLQSLWLNDAFLPPAMPHRLASLKTMVSTSTPLETSSDLNIDPLEPSSDLSSDEKENESEEAKENFKRDKREKFNPSTKPIRRYRTSKKEPLIAIIGRPNVGKSALVNRICATQSGGAIVADESGITRDRTYREANFLGENFHVCDTGGLVFDDDESTLFAKEIRQQAEIAIDEASAVIIVVDGRTGLTAMDSAIADYLRVQVLRRLPVHVAVNKCESETVGALNAAEFWNMGLGEPVPVSALHGVGTAELLENVFDSIVERKTAGISNFGTKVQRLKDAKKKKKSKKQQPGEDDTEYKMRKYGIGDAAEKVVQEYEDALAAFDEQARPEEVNIAIVGRPNVGKSSLLNSIFGDQRAIVSDVAGTTRDSIDAVMERPGENEGDLSTIYRFVDTAGIRRRSKVEYGPEFFMVNRALRAIRRADVGK